MIKILVADDHPIVRAGLKQILIDCADIVVAADVSNGQEVLDKVAKEDFDVVLLDISMQGRGGIEILKQLRVDHPDIAVLILSTHPENQYGVRVLKAGAAGYLTKESAPDKLIEAVRKVSSGGKYITESLAERLAVDVGLNTKGPIHEKLSDREYQVMCMIASGKPIKDIADELSLSVKTISTFRARILQKMNMKNNSELTYYAVKHGLVD